MLQKGMASLELLQMVEQELKDSVRQRNNQNDEKIIAIKTQLYQLRSLQSHISNFISDSEINETQSQNTAQMTQQSVDEGQSQATSQTKFQ